MRCRIADLWVELDCHPKTLDTARPYACESVGKADIKITPADYQMLPIKPPKSAPEPVTDYACSGMCFGRKLLAFGGMVLHACAVVYQGKAYLFTAPSGTGKSTHADLWCRAFAGSYILNDDKPAIRLVDGEAYAYGTPWAGKHRINQNQRVPLGGICLLHRAPTDKIVRATAADATIALYGQTGHTNLCEQEMEWLLNLVESLVQSVPIYHLYCTPTPHAAEVAHQALVSGT